MPRSLVHTLMWSHEHQHYQLSSEGLSEQGSPPEDGQAFARWLDEHTAFAFVGQSGRISVLKEARRGGIGYWYAYRTQHRHTRKRYLGRAAQVTLARLEEVAKELTSEPSPLLLVSEPTAPLPEHREALLSSKLAPPRLPLSLVERARLLGELDAVHTHPLTLVSASAGSGKTTLLSAWVESLRQSERFRTVGHEPALAWLSLEAFDNDSTRFWSSVIAAVQTCLPRVGKAALAMLHQPSTPPLSTLLTHLLNEIGEARKELILVLDDYHVITDQVIHASLLFLLDHLPPTLHLVLISRTDPELPLARLRVRGQMAEIRSDDLRMTLAEAAHFLVQRVGLPLSEADVTTLHQRTEGWIAGLHLAALSLRKQQDIPGWIADFAGSSRYLLDYVQQDILAGLPGPLRHFLLQTSVLTQMNAAVCQAITAGPSAAMSQEMLEEVERANLFVVSLDEQRQWYRYHDLFREALLSALHTTQPELVPLLHHRAADFYEAQGQWHEAITHAFAAADFSAAARLMEQTVEQFWVHGEAETMAHWMQALPERLVREHAPLLLTTALYLLHTVTTTTGEQQERVHTEVQQLIARVETTLQRERDETSRQLAAPQAGTVSLPTDLNARRASEALLQRRLRLLHMQMTLAEAAATGELERFRSMQQEIEEELDRDEEITWQMVSLSGGFILYYTVRNEGALFVPRLLEARERASRSGSPFALIKVRQWLVLAAFEAGRLHLACEESQAALDLIERMAGFALLKGYFEMGLAQVWYQWNRLEEARGRLRTVIQDAARWQHGDLLLWGYIALMRVELARGDLSAVQQALAEFEQLEACQGYLHWWPQLLAVQTDFWLAQGQVKKASDWAASIVFPQGAWDDSLSVAFPVVIRVFFAEHRFREAASLLDSFRAHLDRPTNIRITLTYLAQSLVALHQVGKRDQARVVAARLLELTGPEGHVRVYLDEGDPMRQALEALLATADAGNRDTPPKDGKSRNAGSFSRSYVLRLLAVFKQEEQTRASFVGQPKVPPESRALVGAQGGGEPLSRQERRVLQHLVAGQTYAEMAEALIVSVNTIKTQVSSIYRKMGVSRRAEAIAKTAQLHLLSPLDHI